MSIHGERPTGPYAAASPAGMRVEVPRGIVPVMCLSLAAPILACRQGRRRGESPIGEMVVAEADSREHARAEPARVLPERWLQALSLLAAELARLDAAARTRTAYAVDVRQFATWASDAGLRAADVRTRDVRRYIAALSERGAAPSTSARKLAALRTLFDAMRREGHVAQNPAD